MRIYCSFIRARRRDNRCTGFVVSIAAKNQLAVKVALRYIAVFLVSNCSCVEIRTVFSCEV